MKAIKPLIMAGIDQISSPTLNLIAEIDEFKGAWQLYRRLAADRLNLLKRIATIESVGSSTRIEGARLSDEAVEALLSGVKLHSFRSRDEEEVGGYDALLRTVFEHYETLPFTENYIKQFHQILLQFSTKDVHHRGEYKKFPNHVEAFDPDGKSLGIVFETVSPFDTPRLMAELVEWMDESLTEKELHPLMIVGMFAVIFLAIHPFQDGNGRLSRALTTLLLLKLGYHYVPYSSLESIVETNKEKYYLALRRTQTTLRGDSPNFEPWFLFFLKSLQQQKNHLEVKLKREQIMFSALSELAAKIIELIQAHGKMPIAEILKLTGANRNTLKKQLADLVEKGYIIRHGKGRGTWYAIDLRGV